MDNFIEYTEVPYLQDMLNHLPISPEDEEISSYIQNIINLIRVNYKYEQYQFAYFGLHLLYMTYIYSTAWKISQISPKRYSDVIVFAKPYHGREKDLKIEEARSIFAYSLLPEKDISKLFRIIDLDKSQISYVSDLVDARNEMAHASGKFDILTEQGYDTKAHSVMSSINNIHNCMKTLIRQWYTETLISFCKGEFNDYSEEDVIEEHMVQGFYLSVKELLICNEMSVSSIISEHRGFDKKLRSFKKRLSDYCKEAGYVPE